MSMLTRSVPLLALSLLLGVTAVHAQGTSDYHWYIGGQGGVLSFRTPSQKRTVNPMAGAHLLVTGRRVGLQLAVDQSFGSDETTQSSFVVLDSTNAVVQSGTINWTFQGFRRYSAVAMAYPSKNKNIQPFIGLGGGIIHAVNTAPGEAGELGSSGFLTGMLGLEFRVGPFSAFGQYQVQTKPGFKSMSSVVATDASGKPTRTRFDSAEWSQGAIHTVVGGLRFDLGRARD